MAKEYYRGHEQWRKSNPLRDGTPCPRCGSPMFRVQNLDVGHVIDAVRGGAYGPRRWEHTICNRRAGGQLGAQRKKERRAIDNTDTREPHSEEW